MQAERHAAGIASFLFVAAFSSALAAQVPWQVNQPASSLDVDGVLATPFSSAVTTACVQVPVTVTFASTALGAPFEAAIGFRPLVPGGAPGSATTAGGQVVNVDLLDPALIFLFGGAAPALQPFPGTIIAAVATTPLPITVTIQQVVVTPVSPDAIALSQGCQLDTVAGQPVQGPFDDDGFFTISLGVPPLCGPPAVPFFGTAYTQINVVSNGRVMFGPNPTAVPASPSIALALGDDPSVNAWTDFDPSSGGSVITSVPSPGIVRVSFASVPYFASALTASFNFEVDVAGTVSIQGLAGITNFSGTMFLGISAGNLGATNPGPSSFAPTTVLNPGPAGRGMIYRTGPSGTLTPGATFIRFTPNVSGNYDWIVF